jgi:alpha-1,6-mannosyltransferase
MESKKLSGYFPWIFIILSEIGFLYMGYGLNRSQFLPFILVFTLLFLFYIAILKTHKSNQLYKFLIVSAIIFRISLLFSIPNMSDDYLRFIFDGQLVTHQTNPFLHVPLENENLDEIFVNEETKVLLTTKNFYTVYPTVCQFVFYVSSSIGGKDVWLNVFILKLFMFLFEGISILSIIALLRYWKLNPNYVFIYALNPLVIIELTGNIHFEAAMISFVLLCVLFLYKKKWILSALFLSMAIASKLLPILILPFVYKHLGFKNFIAYSIVSLTAFVLLMSPFGITIGIPHMYEGLQLYYSYFEFNGSIYYVLNWFNTMLSLGLSKDSISYGLAVMFILSYILIFMNYLKAPVQNIFKPVLLVFSIYLFLATTVNPWYIVPLIAYSVFANNTYVIVWSLLIALTYITFTYIPFRESYVVIALEYIIVYLLFLNNRLLQKGNHVFYQTKGITEN